MSWITPVIREVMGDAAATTHKLKFFENGAVPGLAVSLDKSITNPDVFSAFVKKMQEQHEGVLNAYRTLYLAGGATATPVGANLRQIDFKLVQGAGETRIAAAAGIPPIVVGLSEGLAASTYSNYGQAIRAFGRGTMAYLWQNMAGSFGHLVDVPAGAELWYDERHIKMLQEDEKDAADIQHVEAQSIETVIRGGFEPDTVVKAVVARDWTLLKHTGLFSVQMQTPGSLKMPEQPPVIPGEPTYQELPAPSNKPGEGSVPPGKTAPALPAPKPALTPREQEIAGLVADGLTNRQIADQLVIGERTVETHLASVMRKTGVHSRVEVSV
jgi:DNA-binding CsgD family transcriptional regulator